MNKWENCGDVNFTTWGGCLIKPTEEKYVYDVFYLCKEDDNYACLCTVDLRDYWIDYEGVLSMVGMEEYALNDFEEMVNNIGAEELVNECIYYYGAEEFSPIYYNDSTHVTDEELEEWLISIGAEEFI